MKRKKKQNKINYEMRTYKFMCKTNIFSSDARFEEKFQ